MRQKPVDLLSLTAETDVEVLVSQIVRQEALISEQRKPQLRKLVYKLIEKIDVADVAHNFYLFKVSTGASFLVRSIFYLKPCDPFVGRSCALIFCLSPIAPSTSLATALSQAVMIGLAR